MLALVKTHTQSSSVVRSSYTNVSEASLIRDLRFLASNREISSQLALSEAVVFQLGFSIRRLAESGTVPVN